MVEVNEAHGGTNAADRNLRRTSWRRNVSEITFLAAAAFAIGAHNFLACRRTKRIGRIIVSTQHQYKMDFSHNSLVLNRY